MKKYEIQLTTELIHKLLKGIKIEQIFGEIRFIMYPPQEGLFITHEELDSIIRDRTNTTERLLKLIEKNS